MTVDSRIENLERRLDELAAEQADLRTQLVRAEMDQWRGRIEDLEVQLQLATMEVRDQVTPLVEQLRNRWLDSREQLEGAGSSLSDIADRLAAGFDDALAAMRDALRREDASVG